MSNIYLDAKGHLTTAAFAAIRNGILSAEELAELGGHLAVCEKCASAFADSFGSRDLAPAPAGFAENVLGRKANERKSSRNTLQLFYYSLRVAVAVCAALLIVFSGAFRSLTSEPQKMKPTMPNFSFVDQISTGLRDFSQKVIHIGGNAHASQKE